ncbi:MAG: SDR family oxidoreductase [Bacteroidales bacterium]|jgi:NAD(P)-dependent dehydrogenase (short-subunit alcohol dehydrogenase family)|nr:SDR family oxidoreductase [Bacteroidales bacterium]
MNNPFSLEGKVVLVTGASSGIGKAIAVECSKSGATVYLTARNQGRLEETLSMMTGGQHKIITADLTKQEDVTHLAESVDKLDGIVLNSGINDKSIIKKLDNDFISKMMDTNFSGPAMLIQALLKNKKINKFASVVFMSSVSAFYPSVSNAMYAASKAAVNQFAKVLALEVLTLKARVNCIQPAFVETEMLKKYTLDNVIDEIRANYPLGRFAKPEEIAYAAIYYLSDASQLVTGTSLVIDGGYTLR